MGYNPSYHTDCDGLGPDNCPVDTVSWWQSAAHANAKSDAAGLQECYTCTGSGIDVKCAVGPNPYDCTGYRLLTEAAWEGAARWRLVLRRVRRDRLRPLRRCPARRQRHPRLPPCKVDSALNHNAPFPTTTVEPREIESGPAGHPLSWAPGRFGAGFRRHREQGTPSSFVRHLTYP
ncbi:MAG: hypothetical protein EXR69_08965 [Myxococcales bacterium]|nr:hypothetical protein [Myxococcales bacterium]